MDKADRVKADHAETDSAQSDIAKKDIAEETAAVVIPAGATAGTTNPAKSTADELTSDAPAGGSASDEAIGPEPAAGADMTEDGSGAGPARPTADASPSEALEAISPTWPDFASASNKKTVPAQDDSGQSRPDVDAIEPVSPAPENAHAFGSGPQEDSATPAPSPSASDAPRPTPPQPNRPASPLLIILGGLVAGGVGFLASQLTMPVMPPDQSTQIARLQQDIASLRDAVVADAQQNGIPQDLADRLEALETSATIAPGAGDLALLDDRLTEIDDRLARLDTMLAQTAATGDEGQEIRADLTGQMAALEAEMGDLRDLALTRLVEAEAAVDTAEARAARAVAQAALDMIAAAFETGAPFAGAVAQLEATSVPVPDAIARSADRGVVTLIELQASFDPAARSGLAAGLQDAPAQNATERLSNFVRSQIGARSLSPREGDDPDAVLSRAAVAMEAGALDMALTEIDRLPQAGQAAMGDWLTRARARQAALAAFPDLTQALAAD